MLCQKPTWEGLASENKSVQRLRAVRENVLVYCHQYVLHVHCLADSTVSSFLFQQLRSHWISNVLCKSFHATVWSMLSASALVSCVFLLAVSARRLEVAEGPLSPETDLDNWKEFLRSEDGGNMGRWKASSEAKEILATKPVPNLEEMKEWTKYLYTQGGFDDHDDAVSKALEILRKDHPSLEEFSTWYMYLYKTARRKAFRKQCNGLASLKRSRQDKCLERWHRRSMVQIALEALGQKHPALEEFKAWFVFIQNSVGKCSQMSMDWALWNYQAGLSLDEFTLWYNYLDLKRVKDSFSTTQTILRKEHPDFEEFKAWSQYLSLVGESQPTTRALEILAVKNHPELEEFKAWSRYLYSVGETQTLTKTWQILTQWHPPLKEVEDMADSFVKVGYDAYKAANLSLDILYYEDPPSFETIKAWSVYVGYEKAIDVLLETEYPAFEDLRSMADFSIKFGWISKVKAGEKVLRLLKTDPDLSFTEFKGWCDCMAHVLPRDKALKKVFEILMQRDHASLKQFKAWLDYMTDVDGANLPKEDALQDVQSLLKSKPNASLHDFKAWLKYFRGPRAGKGGRMTHQQASQKALDEVSREGRSQPP